jgi:CheY-like chemotaxis protein
MHGGSVSAHSDGEWTGSEFAVRLPVMKEIPAARPHTEKLAPLPSGWRILVVDDNYDSADSMATLLSMSGNECLMAHDGRTAIQLAESFSPHAILLDIGLPEMDGYEVCRTIREQPWGSHINIIAMTGWGQADDRKRSKEAGFSAHLVKPVDIAKLSSLMASMSPEDSTSGAVQ